MMIDPREDKLPKWAQELIERERIKASLSWPQFPKPEPVFTCGPNIRSAPTEFRGQQFWQSNVHSGRVTRRWMGKAGGQFTTEEAEATLGRTYGWGESCSGDYYATERDGWRFMAWSIAESAAFALYRVGKETKGEP